MSIDKYTLEFMYVYEMKEIYKICSNWAATECIY